MRLAIGLTLAVTSLFVSQPWAAPPVHVWSHGFGGTSTDEGMSVAVDGAGNVFATGTFFGTANFGGANLVSAGNADIFLAKYDANGVHLWSKRVGGTSSERPIVLAADPTGNVIVTGLFSGTVDFGGGPLVSAGAGDIFLAKYDASGAHLWSKHFGSTGADAGWDVTTDALGNVVVVGYFAGTIDLGGGPLVSAGDQDIVAGKFDPNGVHLWSQRHGGTLRDQGISVKVDGSGNLVIAAQSSGTVDMGGGPLTSAGALDIVLAKFDAGGAHMWSRMFGGPGNDQPAYVALDPSGSVYLAGAFIASVNFGGGALASAGQYDIVLAKYDASGAHLWSQRFGSVDFDVTQSIAVDAVGNVAMTGYFSYSIDFGGGGFTTPGRNTFMAMFDTAGQHLWSGAYGDTLSGSSGNSIVMAGGGSVVATGYFGGGIDFGGSALTSVGNTDVFIVKLDTPVVVPVLITRFDATPRAQGIELSWRFSSDEALDGLAIYRGHGESPLLEIAREDAVTTRSYFDASVVPGETYQYQLLVRTASGDEFLSQLASATLPRLDNRLGQNFPNPFNPRTTIEYTLDASTPVAIEIVDVSGARVRVLDHGVRPAGTHQVEWDGRDGNNRPVGSGVYFYRFADGRSSETRKMVLLK